MAQAGSFPGRTDEPGGSTWTHRKVSDVLGFLSPEKFLGKRTGGTNSPSVLGGLRAQRPCSPSSPPLRLVSLPVDTGGADEAYRQSRATRPGSRADWHQPITRPLLYWGTCRGAPGPIPPLALSTRTHERPTPVPSWKPQDTQEHTGPKSSSPHPSQTPMASKHRAIRTAAQGAPHPPTRAGPSCPGPGKQGWAALRLTLPSSTAQQQHTAGDTAQGDQGAQGDRPGLSSALPRPSHSPEQCRGGSREVRRPHTFRLGMMRRNRTTMSEFTSRAMSHSDSRPSVSGFLERHTGHGLGKPRDAGNRKTGRCVFRQRQMQRASGRRGWGWGGPLSRAQDRAWTATPDGPGRHGLSHPSSYPGQHSGSNAGTPGSGPGTSRRDLVPEPVR